MDAEFLKTLRYNAATSLEKVDAFNSVLFSDDLPSEIAVTQYTFIFSGPPLIEHGMANNGADLTPIGLVQDLQLSGQRQIAPIAELGNRYFRHVAGRTNHSATLSRVVSRSANVLGMMYAWLLKTKPVFHQNPTNGQTNLTDGEGNTMDYSLHALSLDSDMLDIPFGLYVVKLTEDGEQIACSYWERCMIAGYTEMVQSGQVMVMEQIQMVMARVLPAPNIMKPGATSSYQVGGSYRGSGSPANQPSRAYSPPEGALLNLTPEELAKYDVQATGNASLINVNADPLNASTFGGFGATAPSQDSGAPPIFGGTAGGLP